MSAVVTGCIIGSFPLDSTPQLLRYHTDHIPKPIPHDTFDTVVAGATLQDDMMVGNEDEGASSSTSGIEAMVSGLGEALAKEAEFYSDRLSSVKLSVSASMIPSQLTSKGTLRRTAMRMLLLRYLNHPTAPAVTIGLLPSSTSPSTCYVGEGGALLTSRLSNIELLSLGVKPGEKLTGEVTHVSGTSIGVTVLGTWPATIPSGNMLSDWTYDEGEATWKRQPPAAAVVKKGTRVTFFVDSVVTGSGSAAATNDNDDDSYDWDASQTGGNRGCYGVGGVEEDDVDATFTRKWAAATKAIEADPNATSFRSLVTSKKIRDTTTVISAESTFTIIGALLEPAGAGAVAAKGRTAELEKVEDGEEDEGEKVTKKRKHHHHHHHHHHHEEEEETEVSPKASKTVKIEKKHKKHRKLSH